MNAFAAPPTTDAAARASRTRWTSADLSLIAVFAALISAFSLLPGIPLGAGVPITLQTLAVMLTGIILGPTRAAAAVGLFQAAGLARPASRLSPRPRPSSYEQTRRDGARCSTGCSTTRSG